MKVLAKAIVEYHRDDTSSTLYGLIARRLYREEAPSKKSDKGTATITSEYPYIVYRIVDDIPFEIMWEHQGEQLRIQFDIWSNKNGAGQAEDVYDALKEKYDNCQNQLTVTGYTCVRFRRDVARLVKDQESGLWRYMVDYLVLLNKN